MEYGVDKVPLPYQPFPGHILPAAGIPLPDEEDVLLVKGGYTPPDPVATHRVPFQATPLQVENMSIPIPVHVIPSEEYAMELVPVPTATNRDPFHATPLPVVNMLVPVTPVQVIPSVDQAIELSPPVPTATNFAPFQTIPLQVVNVVLL